MATENTVSIIVPVFNEEAYLSDTLRDLQKQTYSNIEVLLIDDGSTDKSGDICDSICREDSRFQVFHLKNGGVAAARNFGLEKITGQYCMFIDSDDLIKQNYVEAMVNVAEKTNAEIIICDKIDGKYNPVDRFHKHICSPSPKYENISLKEFRFTNKYRHDTVWAALYSREAATSEKFDLSLPIAEDTLYFAKLLKNFGQLAYVHETYYYYTFKTDSLAHSKYGINHSFEITAWEMICKEYAESLEQSLYNLNHSPSENAWVRFCAEFPYESKDFLNECFVALAQRCRKNYVIATIEEYSDKNIIQNFHDKVKSLWPYIYKSKVMSFRNKLSFLSFIVYPSLTVMYSTADSHKAQKAQAK